MPQRRRQNARHRIEWSASSAGASATLFPVNFRFTDAQYVLNLHLKAFAPGIYERHFKAGSNPKNHAVQFEVEPN